ncbi:unnamed protein product, partial [Effrenium voratum]
RKGHVTRQDLLWALHEREDLYRSFCRYYIEAEDEYAYWCEQVGQEVRPPPGIRPPEEKDPRYVDDWQSVRRALDNNSTDFENELKSWLYQELVAPKTMAGRKSLIIRKSLEFLDEACKQVALLRAPHQVSVHQKCNKMTLEILINYFKMQGLLLEFQTATVLNAVPGLQGWV